MKQVKLSEFNTYLTEQIGQPYVWGGQHLRLTPENYVREITKREKDATHRATAIKYCENRFADGKTVLFAYDCSGLGMFYLQNCEKVYSHDMTANGMMGQCVLMDEPKKGYWVFRLNDSGKAVHIGYMVTDGYVIHARKILLQSCHLESKNRLHNCTNFRARGKIKNVNCGGGNLLGDCMN